MSRRMQPAPVSRLSVGRWYATLVALLLVAAALRFAALPALPPGVAHDEVAEVLIAQAILRGQHALYFREAYGQEPLFLYLVAGALALLGHNVLALRFVAAAIGVLTVAAGARWTRRLFGPRVALVAAAGLSVMLWPVFWSRVGLRGMTLPLTMCLGAEALWRALWGPSRSLRHGALAGLWWGLSAYTYLAARGVPLLLGAFLLYLLLVHRDRVRRRWRALALAGGCALLIALPLGAHLLAHPEAQTRVYEVNAPLTALRQGDPRPVLANVPRVLGMFSVRGDATERNNLPGRPVFPEPLWALAFYGGLAVALLRWRDPRCGFLLLWLGVMLTPTLVTADAPNFVRALGALPAVMALPGLGVVALAGRPRRRRALVAAAMALAFALNLGLTARDYALRWPAIPATQFVWQTDLAAVAAWLDAHPDVRHVAVGGLSNATMDAPSLNLLLRRDDVVARWCDPGSPLGTGGAVVLPATGGHLLVPDVVPVAQPVRVHLADGALDVREHPRFTAYRLPSPVPAGGTSFEGGVHLVRVARPPGPWASGAPVTLSTVWAAAGDGPRPPLKAFVHLVDGAGDLVAQHDGLDSPARFWQPGDRVVQLHTLALPPDLPPGAYSLRVGLYDRETRVPLPALDGQPYVTVAVTVR